MMTEIRIIVISEGYWLGGKLLGAGNILSLDIGGDYVGVHKAKIHWVVHLECIHVTMYSSCLNKNVWKN